MGAEGLLSPDMAAYCAANSRAARRGGAGADENARPPPSVAYPHGATVAARAPAVPFLTSGQAAHPCNTTVGAWRWGSRCLAPGGARWAACACGRVDPVPACLPARLAGAAWWEDARGSGGGAAGRLAVLGSAAMFDDEWLGREGNAPLLDFLVGAA